MGDLGLAKSTSQEQSLTMTGSSMDTPNYISPEQAEGAKEIGIGTDIYSLGCPLFHMIAGTAPYSGESAFSIMMKHVSAPITDLRQVRPECPATLAAVLAKTMQKSPADRQTGSRVTRSCSPTSGVLTKTSMNRLTQRIGWRSYWCAWFPRGAGSSELRRVLTTTVFPIARRRQG